jgi:hypothetical protein
MSYGNSALSQEIAAIMKTAEARANMEEKGKKEENPFKAMRKEEKKGKEKKSMGTSMHGGYDTSGMEATASADQMDKLADALSYMAYNFHDLIDDRSPHDKLAELHAFAAEAQKIASEGGLLENTLNDDKHTKNKQPEPHKGMRTIPRDPLMQDSNKFKNTMNEDNTHIEWKGNMFKDKRAHVLHSVLRKHANPMAAPPQGAPAQPPPQAAPAPQGAPAQPMQVPAGPNPLQIATQLAQAGSLTPESLAQAAGISPEEAAAVIASISGGSGAPAQPPPQAAPAQPMQPQAQQPGMEVQASVSETFKDALRKLAGEDVSRAVISAPKSNERPEDEEVRSRHLPGSNAVQSNEAAIAFTTQEGEKHRDGTLKSVLTWPVGQQRKSGKHTGGYHMDSLITTKTSSAMKRVLSRRRPN